MFATFRSVKIYIFQIIPKYCNFRSIADIFLTTFYIFVFANIYDRNFGCWDMSLQKRNLKKVLNHPSFFNEDVENINKFIALNKFQAWPVFFSTECIAKRRRAHHWQSHLVLGRSREWFSPFFLPKSRALLSVGGKLNNDNNHLPLRPQQSNLFHLCEPPTKTCWQWHHYYWLAFLPLVLGEKLAGISLLIMSTNGPGSLLWLG